MATTNERHELVYRHNHITRITHWTNAIALMILFMSGLMIFNAHPHLYGATFRNRKKQFFPSERPTTTVIFAVMSGCTTDKLIRLDSWACNKALSVHCRVPFRAG